MYMAARTAMVQSKLSDLLL